jgi:diguanylate cyclase
MFSFSPLIFYDIKKAPHHVSSRLEEQNSMSDGSVQDLTHSPGWFRRIMTVYWICAGITIGTEAFKNLILHNSTDDFFYNYLLIHASAMLLTLGAVEAASLLYRYRNDYVLILAGTIVTGAIVASHPEVTLLPAILLSPLLVAVMSFRISRILFAAAITITKFSILLIVIPELRQVHSGISLISAYYVMIGTAFMMILTVNRGREILLHLDQSNTARQELMIKNIIMDKLFMMDALTELYNHKTFHEYLEKLIEYSETNGLTLQLAILDLDNFKRVNDTYGHRAGDIVLTRTAAVLRENVTSNDFVARYGGEEFAIIFTEKTIAESQAILERIRGILASTLHEEAGNQPVTCSAGLELYRPGLGKERLFRLTDESLYNAKRSGKNQVYTSIPHSGDL